MKRKIPKKKKQVEIEEGEDESGNENNDEELDEDIKMFEKKDENKNIVNEEEGEEEEEEGEFEPMIKRIKVNISDVKFQVIRNDGSRNNLVKLLAARNVYTMMLPNMPKDYTTRLVFDLTHVTLIGTIQDRVMCGITFKPFEEQGFIEIAFVAVSSVYQVSGIGSVMMNNLKCVCQRLKIFRMLTCADNHAVGYFKKQGFSPDITLDPKRYEGYIKNYDSVTLMECVIRPGIDYINFRRILEEQKLMILKRLEINRMNCTSIVYKGLKFEKRKNKETGKMEVVPKKMKDVPGLIPYSEEKQKPKLHEKQIKNLLLSIVDYISSIPAAWPFKEPVNTKVVPDYLEIVDEPMDLRTLSKNIRIGQYKKNTLLFHIDMVKIFQNARAYNAKNTAYYKTANECQRTYLDYIQREEINLKQFFPSDYKEYQEYRDSLDYPWKDLHEEELE